MTAKCVDAPLTLALRTVCPHLPVARERFLDRGSENINYKFHFAKK